VAHVTPDTAVALEATGHAFQLYDRLVDRAGPGAVAPPLWLKLRVGAAHRLGGRRTPRQAAGARHLTDRLGAPGRRGGSSGRWDRGGNGRHRLATGSC
jgi:hypothetical protein